MQQNPAYLTVIVLARVITRLGALQDVNTKVIEGLFASDLNYLQTLYERLNGEGGETAAVERLNGGAAVLDRMGGRFGVLGEA